MAPYLLSIGRHFVHIFFNVIHPGSHFRHLYFEKYYQNDPLDQYAPLSSIGMKHQIMPKPHMWTSLIMSHSQLLIVEQYCACVYACFPVKASISRCPL